MSDVISVVAGDEFPLTVPPRWLPELFEVLWRVVALKTEANQWPMIPPPDLDFESQAYVTAALKNIENDKRRRQGQHLTILPGKMGPFWMARANFFPSQGRLP